MTWANGDQYYGKFRKDKMHGYGVYSCKNGDKYEGHWKNDSVSTLHSILF